MTDIHPLWYTAAMIVVTIIALIIAARYTLKSLAALFDRGRSSGDTRTMNEPRGDSITAADVKTLRLLQKDIQQMGCDTTDFSEYFGDDFTEEDYEHIQSRLKQAEQQLRLKEANQVMDDEDDGDEMTERDTKAEQLAEIQHIMQSGGYGECGMDMLQQQYGLYA